MRQPTTLVVLLTALFANWTGASADRHAPSLPAASRVRHLLIKPNPAPLGRHIVVIVTGLKQGEQIPTPVYPPLAHVQRWRLPLPTRSYLQSAVAGDTVAFATKACAACGAVLHLGNLSTGRSRTIAQLPKDAAQLVLQLSSTWLVWIEGLYPGPGWKLWAWNRGTGQRRLVDSSATEGGPAAPAFPEISLWGHTLAWVRHDCLQGCTRPGPSTLRLVDLAAGTPKIISHATYACRQIAFPALSDTVLSWVGAPLGGYGCPAPNTWTIVAQDRRTGHISFREIHLNQDQIADEFTGQGWREAWVEHLKSTNRDNRVLLMDLRSGGQRVIARQQAYSPRLTDRVLAWLGGYGERVEALDLRTGRRYLLGHGTTGPTRDVALGTWLGQPSEGRVIWEESSFNPSGGPFHDSLVVAAVP